MGLDVRIEHNTQVFTNSDQSCKIPNLEITAPIGPPLVGHQITFEGEIYRPTGCDVDISILHTYYAVASDGFPLSFDGGVYASTAEDMQLEPPNSAGWQKVVVKVGPLKENRFTSAGVAYYFPYHLKRINVQWQADHSNCGCPGPVKIFNFIFMKNCSLTLTYADQLCQCPLNTLLAAGCKCGGN